MSIRLLHRLPHACGAGPRASAPTLHGSMAPWLRNYPTLVGSGFMFGCGRMGGMAWHGMLAIPPTRAQPTTQGPSPTTHPCLAIPRREILPAAARPTIPC